MIKATRGKFKNSKTPIVGNFVRDNKLLEEVNEGIAAITDISNIVKPIEDLTKRIIKRLPKVKPVISKREVDTSTIGSTLRSILPNDNPIPGTESNLAKDILTFSSNITKQIEQTSNNVRQFASDVVGSTSINGVNAIDLADTTLVSVAAIKKAIKAKDYDYITGFIDGIADPFVKKHVVETNLNIAASEGNSKAVISLAAQKDPNSPTGIIPGKYVGAPKPVRTVEGEKDARNVYRLFDTISTGWEIKVGLDQRTPFLFDTKQRERIDKALDIPEIDISNPATPPFSSTQRLKLLSRNSLIR